MSAAAMLVLAQSLGDSRGTLGFPHQSTEGEQLFMRSFLSDLLFLTLDCVTGYIVWL